MTRRAGLSNSFTKGVIDPALSERIDLAHYYNALESAQNIEVFPQGGFRRRAGTSVGTAAQRIRRRLKPIAVTSAMLSAWNGGTKAYLLDQSGTLFTTSAVSGSPFEIVNVDLGVPTAVAAVDLLDYRCAAGRFPRSISVEWWSGSAWVAFAPSSATARKTMSTDARTRRFALAPGPVVTARSWRVVAYDAVGADAVTLSGIRFFAEKRQLSPQRSGTFARASDLVYEWVLSDRNIDIFRDRVWQASIPSGIDAQQIADVTWTTSLDSMILYHEDVATRLVQRQGANDEWNVAPAVWTNLPALTPGTAFAGDQDEVQEIALPGIVTGDRIVLWLGDVVTAPIAYSDDGGFPGTVAAALEAIGVGSGLVVTAMALPLRGVRLSFYGNAGARRWPLVTASALDRDDLDPHTTIVQRGLDAQGPIIGSTTGFPRCGAIYQERHIVGGMRAAPLTYGVSRYGLPWDFLDDADPFTADLGFFATLNADHLDVIEQISISRHILFLTTQGEWYAEARTIDATQPFNVQLATGYGLLSSVPVMFCDGALTFVDRGGRTLRDLVYSDVELSYKAPPLSLLAPHLLTGIVDLGYRQARSTSEGHQVFLVNADGTLAFLSLLREQEIVAMAPWTTDGAFRGAVGDVLGRVFLVVERQTLTGGADLYLEKLDGSHTLDAAVTPSDGIVRDTVSGLDHLEGRDVWAWVDRDLVGPMRVSGGTARLPHPGVVQACGLHPTLRARLPRLREKLQSGHPWRPPARIYEIGLALAGTGQVDVAVNGGPFRDVPLTFEASRALDIAAEPPRDTTGGTGSATTAESLERLAKAITLIPASGEFAYAVDEIVTKRIHYAAGHFGVYDSTVQLNMHNTSGQPDMLVSLGQMRQGLPELARVSMFVGWFGSDLRASSCTIVPKVEHPTHPNITYAPYDWSVAGLTRGSAELTSRIDDRPAYGGTPSDNTVVDALRTMRQQDLAVTLTPFLMMDVPAGNTLPNPYGGGSQAPFPWRGRITCHPAPGQPGTVDLDAAAAAQVAAFVGTVSPADFTIAGETVTYSGPAEWSYRRFILHNAALAKAAGGVDTFVIGSEMRGLTWVRSALGVYPFVAALVALAADVKTMLGPATKVVYAADWSEFPAHQTGVSGEAFFHLDPLWSSPHIDAIGIDNYLPLADWRNGTEHADYAAGWTSIYDRAYLQTNISGGEYFDWYYGSQQDRDDQVRSPITDGAYGRPWVWRAKDLVGWWSNAHRDRPAGVENASPTAWQPRSKPIWFMELGCPAVDKGANQPNVFYDPKSAESALPYYSAGVRDDRMQRAFIEATLAYWTPGQTGFSEAGNPVSGVYPGRMVDHTRIYLYTWDARFYPGFPELGDVWSDGVLWEFGHWLTGRLRVSFGDDQAADALSVGLSPELPLRDRLLTGTVRVTNLRGFSRHPSIELSQSRPAPLEVRGIRYEVVHG